ncbi:MAG: DUF1648 domain-containing protein [Bacteroidales bacterium]|nr:DUF1648 domain-containing protein [Bacteroidales bacterium]
MENHQSKTTYDKILEIVAVAALLWAFYPLLFYNSIDSDATFPTHYNFAGEVDGWGNRTSLWILPIIAILFYVGLSIVEMLPRIMKYSRKMSEQDAGHLYRIGVQLIRHVKVLTILILAYGSNDIYAGAIDKSFVHSPVIIFLFIAALFLTVVIYTIKMLRCKPSSMKN